MLGCSTIADAEISITDSAAIVSSNSAWMLEAEQHFVEESSYDLLTDNIGNFWGKKIDGRPVILAIPPTTRVGRLESLVNDYNVAFSTSNMPQDLEIYAKSYPHPEYGNYYNFIQNYVDTVILCPQIDDPKIPETIHGRTSFLGYHDNLFYPAGGRIILLSLTDFYQAPSTYASTLFRLFITVHEAAHKQFSYLIFSKQIPNHMINNFRLFDERHALIAGIEFLEIILQRPLSDNDRFYLTRHYRNDLTNLREHNRQLRLPVENRERFPAPR